VSDSSRDPTRPAIITTPDRVADVLPADDPVSTFVLALGWSIADLVAIHKRMESCADDDAELLFWMGLAWSRYYEISGLLKVSRSPAFPEIKAFVESLPAQTTDRLGAIQKPRRKFDDVIRGLRNEFSHYPELANSAQAEARWAEIREVLVEGAEDRVRFRPGNLRDAELTWLADLRARRVLSIVGGEETFADLAALLAEAVTEAVRFMNEALDEKMVSGSS
jgi:hypothetical protein